MTNQELAKAYLTCFCAGDIKGIQLLLASDLKFIGTFYTYHSATEYLNGLSNNPPEKSVYTVLSITEYKHSVAVFYEYQKLVQVLLIAQLFRIRNQKIHEVLLVYDGRGIS